VLDIFQFSFAYLAENISKTANVLVNQWLTTFIIILIMMLMMVVIIIIIIIIINKEIMWRFAKKYCRGTLCSLKNKNEKTVD